jgi:hypothetical protein
MRPRAPGAAVTPVAAAARRLFVRPALRPARARPKLDAARRRPAAVRRRNVSINKETSMQAHSQRWIFAAVIYFCLGVALGVHMGKSGDHSLFPVHAHINLLGWVSMALIGIIYHFFPVAGASRLATVQFWLYNAMFVVMMGALALYLKGNQGMGPVLGITSMVLLATIVTFAGNVLWKRA